MPQRMAGRPMSRVMLVTLLTRELVTTSAPRPPLAPSTKAKIRLPIPEQYGMTRVPRTVPSTPLSVMASSRQIMRNEAAMKRPRKHQGAKAPVLSIHFKNELKGRSLARSRGRAKRVFGPVCITLPGPRAIPARSA